VVGEAPGADEDAQGKGFVGRAGRTLHKLLEEHGLRRGYEYGCANIVRCRPPDNRRPTMQEIVHCLPLLAETIGRAQPRAVITVGETATRAITGIVGLWVNIKALREHGHNPRQAEMICPPEIKPCGHMGRCWSQSHTHHPWHGTGTHQMAGSGLMLGLNR
jgi:DNA polymerase